MAADVYRPAAIDQLETLGEQVGVPVFNDGTTPPGGHRPRGRGGTKGCNLVIVDTAGRLHIDDVLMDELVDIRQAVKPSSSSSSPTP